MNASLDSCHALISVIAGSGITEAVISPGSRNAPLIHAVDMCDKIHPTVVIDERSAAFVALGKASISGKCVMLACTSGTAVLNYAPALAEAKARQIPLLVVTADRPHEMIGRNEQQTIWQQGVYGSNVKCGFNINCRDGERVRFLTACEAVALANQYPDGPVHINIEIDNPALIDIADEHIPLEKDLIGCIYPSMQLDAGQMRIIAEQLQPPVKVMIVAGSHKPDWKLNRALSRLCSFGNYIVMADNLANVHGHGIIDCPETVTTGMPCGMSDELKPDVVITYGGPMLSNTLRQMLRDIKPEHWHVGINELACDTFGSITRRIETIPAVFFAQLVAVVRRTGISSHYTDRWVETADKIITEAHRYVDTLPWCDLTAVTRLLSITPRECNIHFSNGMSVRYGQVFPSPFHRCDCNRGVSGIEGSTSTAIGASTEYRENTVLITGDMSAMYDLNALTLPFARNNIKIVVINNRGGEIFRFIPGTRDYAEVNRYMAVSDSSYDISATAGTMGYRIYRACDMNTLVSQYTAMLNDKSAPGMLIVTTDENTNSKYMNQFINRNK